MAGMTKDEQITALTLQVEQLQTALRAALERIAELEQRLHKNSRNSDKPPSSDGLSKKPAIPRKKGERKTGGQAGHSGKTLRAVSQPHHTQVHPVQEAVCSCGCRLDAVAGDSDYWERRQVFDLPPTLLEVTEHRVERKTCPSCQRQHLGRFPVGVTAPVQYGERVRALAVLLNVEQSMPLARIQELFAGLTGHGINESTIHAAVERSFDTLAVEQDLIHQALRASPTAHADETGGRIAGKLHWIHGFGSAEHTLFVVREQRGGSVINGPDSHLAAFEGWLIHDCLASYLIMPGAVKHGLCNAHLLRELTARMEADDPPEWPARLHELLLDAYRKSDYGRGVVEPQQRRQLKARYTAILKLADEQEPPPVAGKRGRPKKSKGRNLYERFDKYRQAVLAFMHHAHVPFTNNLGERDLRPWKTKLKVSGCFRTLAGAQRYARIKGFCSTAKKQGKTVFDELINVQRGTSFLRLT